MENTQENPDAKSGGGKRAKIFGIGFHKTGTTSLGEALQGLGWSAAPIFSTKRIDLDRVIPCC